ncbi:MAG: glycosyltransferase family 4 protein [Bacteroidales bacterium]|jgi:glycosyltransferase involved in cell wall biosynthesis|nr:glycosyltransferase family 4 protein [Bacteroidales bacterium]
MNILYFTDDYKKPNISHDICNALNEIGEDITLFSFVAIKNANIEDYYFNDAKYKVHNAFLKISVLRYKYDFIYKINTKYKTVKEFIIRNKFDVIYAYSLFSTGAIAYKIYKKYNIPYVVAVRGTDLNLYLKYMFHLWPLGIKILNNAKSIIFITENIKQSFFKALPIKLFNFSNYSKCNIISNGIDDIFIKNRNNTKREKASNILYIGSFDSNKNVMLLMRAFLNVKKRYSYLKLTLVGGGGNNNEQVIDFVNEHKDSIFYYGKEYDKQKLLQIIRENDIFAMISHSETFGLVYLEAMSQGLPIIYTKGQGIDGTFNNKRIGEKVNSYSIKDVSKKISQMIKEYDKYEFIGEEILNYSWHNIANKMIKIIKS